MGEFKDETMKCKDCGAEFVFTAGEQAFYAEKGFQNKPARCPACRKAKKDSRNSFRPRKDSDNNSWRNAA